VQLTPARSLLASLRHRSSELKAWTYTLYLAYRDPRVSWPTRVVTLAVVAYAFSPLDLIPDFIPVLGYLDDLILVPLGIALAIRLIPPDVLADCRARAAETIDAKRPTNWVAAGVIVVIWLLALAVAALAVARAVGW
jgi:uncharacterized membrane protein YkvA (DUF1232 family)